MHADSGISNDNFDSSRVPVEDSRKTFDLLNKIQRWRSIKLFYGNVMFPTIPPPLLCFRRCFLI